jgi:hypothetical protein
VEQSELEKPDFWGCCSSQRCEGLAVMDHLISTLEFRL